MTLQACGYDKQVESTIFKFINTIIMIETKEGLLEYWTEQSLPQGTAENIHWLRHSCDAFFLDKGYRPLNYPHSDAFQTYHNPKGNKAVRVNIARTFDDSLLGNENWIIVEARGNTYVTPYNAARDMGVITSIRGMYFTDSDNSTAEDLIKSTEILIDNNLAYEI